jgi:hypothetical protein
MTDQYCSRSVRAQCRKNVKGLLTLQKRIIDEYGCPHLLQTNFCLLHGESTLARTLHRLAPFLHRRFHAALLFFLWATDGFLLQPELHRFG